MSVTLTLPSVEREVVARAAERVVLLHARGDDEETVAILSFADAEQRVSLPGPAGEWITRLDASDESFLGDGEIVAERLHSDDAATVCRSPVRADLRERVTR